MVVRKEENNDEQKNNTTQKTKTHLFTSHNPLIGVRRSCVYIYISYIILIFVFHKNWIGQYYRIYFFFLFSLSLSLSYLYFLFCFCVVFENFLFFCLFFYIIIFLLLLLYIFISSLCAYTKCYHYKYIVSYIYYVKKYDWKKNHHAVGRSVSL